MKTKLMDRITKNKKAYKLKIKRLSILLLVFIFINGYSMGRVRLTKEDFVFRAKEIHGNRYCYDETKFIGTNNKVNILCSVHGEFEQIAHSHLAGRGCSKCSFYEIHTNNISTIDDFISQSKQKHNNKYDYSKSVYINNVTKITIICPLHGEFKQTPQHHKRGSGCKKCGNINTGKAAIENSRGWSLKDWESKFGKKPNSVPKLYVIHCFNEYESFLKIGITMRSIDKRFCNKQLMPYNYSVIDEINDSANKIFNGEIQLKKELKEYRYKPNLKFSGWYECFICDSRIELDEIIKKLFYEQN